MFPHRVAMHTTPLCCSKSYFDFIRCSDLGVRNAEWAGALCPQEQNFVFSGEVVLPDEMRRIQNLMAGALVRILH